MGDDARFDADVSTARPAPAPAAPALKLEEFLPYRLNVLATLVSQALARVYAERYDIGVPEWRVMATLGQYGVMTGKAIGAHAHMHKTKVSRAVAVLESRKLVARRANRSDMRESFLSLTPAGHAVYCELAPVMLAMAQQLIEAVEPADRAVFDRVLTILTERSVGLAAAQVPSDDSARTSKDG